MSTLYKSYYKKYILDGNNVTFKGSINEILIFLYEKMISIQIVFENQYWEKLRNEYAGQLYTDREQKLVYEDNSSFSNVSNSSQIINNDEDEF